ncbi:VOC family protein [Nonomuraea sp. M3C6]|uniref:VOC family protein n=1 Tax=Nonomuraea marmarensis TaxID=3351344 RepID=A0ABW7AR26_9ACTN
MASDSTHFSAARDNSALGRFWPDALGWNVTATKPARPTSNPRASPIPTPSPSASTSFASRNPKTVKNRVHIDLATTSAAHQADLVARLQDLGATPVDVGQGDVPWTVLADPEGNEFCVLTPR